MDAVASPTSAEGKEIASRSQRVDDMLGQGQQMRTTHKADEAFNRPTPPPLVKHVSVPAYSSPLRHHRRSPSTPHQVKESLDARSEYVTSQDDGVAEHRINQYIIKQEIGRGSFGAVHLAADQFGNEYAVKEFSKARLRKRAQSHILRKPLAARRRGGLQGFNSPLHRLGVDPQPTEQEAESSINLIKEEIAIMKKLHHTNLVQLIEVLDDPTEDSLYMVMEMCKKGVVMRVDLEHDADPYPESLCRFWFRDLILGIEYLHAQGVVHRDIKPDNCLITNDDVLKVVDFGVSEMFEKNSEMKTAKSAGSPAFLPPELCRVRHGDVSGKAADIWSMGVTLYCLKFGRIPFQKDKILELYEAIQTDQPDLSKDTNPDFQDLMNRILEKDPEKRITMKELREHPWVTHGGTDPLLSEEENVAHPVEPPTEAEMEAAITANMRSLMTVVKAVAKFKSLTASKRSPTSFLGEKDAHFTQPPDVLPKGQLLGDAGHRSQSMNLDDRHAIEGALAAEGIHREIIPHDVATPQTHSTTKLDIPPNRYKAISDPPPLETHDSDDSEELLGHFDLGGDGSMADELRPLPPFRSLVRTMDDSGHRGHARDPLENHLYLYIGPSTFAGPSMYSERSNSFIPTDDDVPIVSESPGAADMDIYETAYRDEIERILAKAKEEEREPQVYLTRRVDAKLMAISGLAGRWMAVGEEAKNQIKDYTHFSARKAKVTEVSRALREAARQEYEKRRLERKALIETAKADKAKLHTQKTDPVEIVDSPTSMSPEPNLMGRHTTDEHSQLIPGNWKDKAVDRGRQARSSIMGIVDMVKNKSRSTRSKDDT